MKTIEDNYRQLPPIGDYCRQVQTTERQLHPFYYTDVNKTTKFRLKFPRTGITRSSVDIPTRASNGMPPRSTKKSPKVEHAVPRFRKSRKFERAGPPYYWRVQKWHISNYRDKKLDARKSRFRRYPSEMGRRHFLIKRKS